MSPERTRGGWLGDMYRISRMVRGVLSVVLLTAACLLLPFGTVSVWGQMQLVDQDRYVATMAPLAEQPPVRDAVADAVAEAAVDEVDAGPLQAAVDEFAHRAALSFAHTEAYRNAWDTANRAANRAVLKALQSEEPSYRGEVVVELAPMIRELKKQLSADGVPFADNIPVRPTRVTLVRADDLAPVRRLTGPLETVGPWLPLVGAGLAGAGVALAPRRRTALAGAGFGVSLGAAGLLVATSAGRGVLLGELPAGVSRPAVGTVYDTLTASLNTANWSLLGAGLLLAGACLVPARLGLSSLPRRAGQGPAVPAPAEDAAHSRARA